MAKAALVKTADRIEKHLRAIGLSVERAGSNLSASQYIRVSGVDLDGDGLTLKIRISDHEAKPTYEKRSGPADYEVGPHPMATTNWGGVVIAAAASYGLTAPAPVRGAATKWRKAREAAEMAAAAESEARAAWFLADRAKKAAQATALREAIAAGTHSDLVARIAELQAGIEAAGGNRRRKLKKKLREMMDRL